MKYQLPTDLIHRFFFDIASLFPSQLSDSNISIKIGLTKNLTVLLSQIETSTGSIELNRFLHDPKYVWESELERQAFYINFNSSNVPKLFVPLYLCSKKKIDSVTLDLTASEFTLDGKYVLKGEPLEPNKIKLHLWKSSRLLTKDVVKAFKQSFQFDNILLDNLAPNDPLYLFTIDDRIQALTFLSFLLPEKFNVSKRYYLCKRILLPNFISSEESHLGSVSVFGCAFNKSVYQCLEHSVSEVSRDSKVCFSFEDESYILGLDEDEYIFKGSFGYNLDLITKLASTIYRFQTQENKLPRIGESVRCFTKDVSGSCILQDGFLILEEDLAHE
jgi:hypothetical protein